MQDTFLLYILLIHFLADFALQTSAQAENKSTSNLYLFYHVGSYSVIWFLALFIFFPLPISFFFSLITFVCHFVTDYVTSRLTKTFFEKKDYHNGYVVIGFDQILHYIQIWITLKFLLL